MIKVIDQVDDGKGNFRFWVVPDLEERPWPPQEHVRQGTKAMGWVILNRPAVVRALAPIQSLSARLPGTAPESDRYPPAESRSRGRNWSRLTGTCRALTSFVAHSLSCHLRKECVS